jgi:hypothetical protein
MKTAKFYLLAGMFISANVSTAQNIHYTAHEWGTFTSLCGSDGLPLNGLYVEEERLPVFVHNIGGSFPMLAYDFGKGTPSDVQLAHVTIKMETPVIYFYSNTSFNADVKVQFTHGLIGQWFPDDSAGVSASYYNNFGPMLDFGNTQSPVSNYIEWKAKVLPLTTDPNIVLKYGETNTWTAPRATDANILQWGGEYEKFLFYRGIGNFEQPVNLSFDNHDNLVIKNGYPDAIPYFFVYDKEDNGDVKVWYSGAIVAGGSKTISQVSTVLSVSDFNGKLTEFQSALTSAGLYDKEAAAMLNTWKTSYFGKSGLRVFWIVPKKFTDDILPLTMNPAPDALERVLIGRSEIMTTQQEKRIYNYYKTDPTLSILAGDRFIEAYKDRMAYLDANPSALQAVNDKAANSGINSLLHNPEKLILYPNPARTNINLSIENAGSGNVSISLSDLEGRGIINTNDIINGDFYQKGIDISTLSNGIYLIHVQTISNNYTARIVKE